MSTFAVPHWALALLALGCSQTAEDHDHVQSKAPSTEEASGGSAGEDSGSGGGSTSATGGVLGAGATSAGGSDAHGSGGTGSVDVPGAGGGASGGQMGLSTNREDFGLGQGSQCADQFTVCEDFEDTPVGELPLGFSLTGYGNRTVAVSEAQSARGSRSLQLEIGADQSAVVAMLRLDDVVTLANDHFGRMFYRIEGPGPSEFVHFDVLEAVGPWAEHQNGVRFSSTGTGAGNSSSNWSWIFNVQPFGPGAGGEFGTEGDRSVHPVVDEWMCLEWAFDATAQTATYYHDGAAINYLVIDSERSEIPVFTEIGVGFQKFQNTGAIRVWLDELALDTSRIGCNY